MMYFELFFLLKFTKLQNHTFYLLSFKDPDEEKFVVCSSCDSRKLNNFFV